MKKIVIFFLVTLQVFSTAGFAQTSKARTPEYDQEAVATSVWPQSESRWVQQQKGRASKEQKESILQWGMKVGMGLLEDIPSPISSSKSSPQILRAQKKFDEELANYYERLWYVYFNDAQFVETALPKISEAVVRIKELCRAKLNKDCSEFTRERIFISPTPLDVRVFKDGKNSFEISADAFVGPNYLDQMVSRLAEVGYFALGYDVYQKFLQAANYRSRLSGQEPPMNEQGKLFAQWLVGHSVSNDYKPHLNAIATRQKYLSYVKDPELIKDVRDLKTLTISMRVIKFKDSRGEDRSQYAPCSSNYDPVITRLLVEAPLCQEANTNALIGGGWESLKNKLTEALAKKTTNQVGWKGLAASAALMAIGILVSKKLAAQEGAKLAARSLLFVTRFTTVVLAQASISVYNSQANTTLLWKLNPNKVIDENKLELFMEFAFDEAWLGQLDKKEFRDEFLKKLSAIGIELEIRQGKLEIAGE